MPTLLGVFEKYLFRRWVCRSVCLSLQTNVGIIFNPISYHRIYGESLMMICPAAVLFGRHENSTRALGLQSYCYNNIVR